MDRVDAGHQGLVEQAQQGAEFGAGGGEGFAVVEAGGFDELFECGVGAEDFVEVVGVVAGLECEGLGAKPHRCDRNVRCCLRAQKFSHVMVSQ